MIPLQVQARFWSLADETANPRYVAADLLSQAEHDEMASAILVTTSKELAEKVSEEVDGFCKNPFQKRDHQTNHWIIMDTSWWQRTLEDAIETVE